MLLKPFRPVTALVAMGRDVGEKPKTPPQHSARASLRHPMDHNDPGEVLGKARSVWKILASVGSLLCSNLQACCRLRWIFRSIFDAMAPLRHSSSSLAKSSVPAVERIAYGQSSHAPWMYWIHGFAFCLFTFGTAAFFLPRFSSGLPPWPFAPPADSVPPASPLPANALLSATALPASSQAPDPKGNDARAMAARTAEPPKKTLSLPEEPPRTVTLPVQSSPLDMASAFSPVVPTGHGLLDVRIPRYGDVLVNRRLMGKGPRLVIPLPPGMYDIRLREKGDTVPLVVIVRRGMKTKVDLSHPWSM
jgi:hypothetical protein